MNTRREFIKKAALISGAAGFLGGLPAAVQRAFAIDPEPGSTFLDAEHIVILMQENRSFDHAYGTLQGVRGFNDPRAVRLPNGNPVWLQTNARGETHAPFRLNFKETKATWMGSLPHSWTNQVDARNHGKHDGWLEAKRSGHTGYANMPLTLGYYTRQDIPFYYAMADAFTICDQHFCSSLTGTMPNRLYLWTGTIRGTHDASAPAKVLNEEVEYESSASWTTFPERLEDAGISWKVYQNELSLDVGMTDLEAAWLSNFGDNPLEWFSQYHARFLPAYRKELDSKLKVLPGQIKELEKKLESLDPASQEYLRTRKRLDLVQESLVDARAHASKWTAAAFERLSPREKNLFAKAFCTNQDDPAYHELISVRYRDGNKQREMNIPKGDVLHQFRSDVQTGALPTVSWIVAPESFSDHPSSAWFGAWYVSEVLDILTHNPSVWKKTVLLLTYDENDGYFDHVPPFVAPHPEKPETGSVSSGLKIREDYVTMEEELKHKPSSAARENSIGLGFRVPLVIASPWSRGGCVCSQVFDHTSALQFLEKFLTHKSGKQIVETNISDWRRVVSGDLTSAFKPFLGETISLPAPVAKEPFLEQVHRAQFERLPDVPRPLSGQQIAEINATGHQASPLLPSQEPGTRASCPLPYELHADGRFDHERGIFEIAFACGKAVFGEASAGAAFIVYAPDWHAASISVDPANPKWERCRNWNFAVAAGSSLQYAWRLKEFQTSRYLLRVHGPNGFFREFDGNATSPALEVRCEHEANVSGKPTGNARLVLANKSPTTALSARVVDNSYKAQEQAVHIAPSSSEQLSLNPEGSSGWYDFTVHLEEGLFAWRYAGRFETGRVGITDPAMGRL
jgi:phospholipase C